MGGRPRWPSGWGRARAARPRARAARGSRRRARRRRGRGARPRACRGRGRAARRLRAGAPRCCTT
eukprot:2945282-Alexandrium_andersonii.AAC.1